jgi:regulator of nucleoside diphosphate kinase
MRRELYRFRNRIDALASFERFLDFDPVLDEPLIADALYSQATERRDDVNNRIVISQDDLLHLAELIREARCIWGGLDELEDKLKRATILPTDALPLDVVRMGSLVTFRDVRTGVMERYELVYPDQADLDKGRLSIFAPIGTALLGARQGDTVWWEVPSGQRGVVILGASHEPDPCEAALAAS